MSGKFTEAFETEDLLRKQKKTVIKPKNLRKYGCNKIPVRFWIGLMVFFTTYTNYTVRVNLSISIVSMTKLRGSKGIPECKLKEMEATRTTTASTLSTTPLNGTDVEPDTTTPPTASTQAPLPDYGPRYDWNQHVQGIIIGSYFWGYVISSLPGGIVAEWLGPFAVIFWVHILSAIFNSASVYATWLHYSLLIICRFICGFGAGLVYPALQCMIARWAPPAEKGKFVAALMGNTLGTCVTWPLVGAVTQSYGWDWGFHVVSIQNLIFCVIFFILAADSPEDHKWITDEEKDYIKEAQGGNVSKKKAVPPYVKIFTSFPFWVLAVLHFGNLWGLYLQLTNVPKFIAEVIGFNLRDSGGLSAMPHLVRLFLGLGFGTIGDALKRNGVSNKCIRKFFVIFSHIIPGLLLIAISFCGCNWIPIVVFLILSMSSNGAAVLTNLQNPQDLAPNFAGTIFGIISCIGGMTGFIVPNITGALIAKNNGVTEWGWNFILGGCMYAGTGLFFILFGSVQQQPWNEKKEDAQA